MLCFFSAAISFLASVSLFPTKYFSLIRTGMWALFWEVRNRTCIKPGRETRHLKHLQNHGEQDRSTQCCVFSAAILFLASISLFSTKYFSLIVAEIWLTTMAIKQAVE